MSWGFTRSGGGDGYGSRGSVSWDITRSGSGGGGSG